ncbi:MAG: serine protease [Bacteroidia bacterium]|nr:serine protease [Bacteroidia bacterium]
MTSNKNDSTNRNPLKSEKTKKERHADRIARKLSNIGSTTILEKIAGLRDSRSEFWEIKDMIEKAQDSVMPGKIQNELNNIEERTQSVVMVVHKKNLLVSEDATSRKVLIWSVPLYERKISSDLSICPDSQYAQQPSAFSEGTGFFLDEEHIATAAHVVVKQEYDIRDYRFVWGVIYSKENPFRKYILVDKSQVWKPVQKEKRLTNKEYQLFSKGSDWAIIKVEKAYKEYHSDKKPFPATKSVTHPDPAATDRPIEIDRKLYSVGHGLGLPMKISYEGEVIKMGESVFECSLTLLGGNSGSPVFDAETHKLIGIYVRGIKKLTKVTNPSGKECLVVKQESQEFEGQECQNIEEVLIALEHLKNPELVHIA